MKVTFSIEVELPEGLAFEPHGTLDQAIFDGLTNYAAIAHLRDACAWIVKKAQAEARGDQTEQYILGAQRLIDHHTRWADILSQAAVTAVEPPAP